MPTQPPPITQSEAERIAQIASQSASEFLHAGTIGITLFSQIITLAAIIMVFVVIWFLTKRSGSEKDLLKTQSTQNADLIVELRKENESAQVYREKHLVAIDRQTDSNESVNGTLRTFLEKQSIQEVAMDKMNLNILTVVNGFGAVNEGIGRIEKAVQDNPIDHATVLDALKDIQTAQMKIFTLIDSRLPERAKTDTPMMLPPNHFPPAPSADLINIKRGTGEAKVVKPEDTDLKPTG